MQQLNELLSMQGMQHNVNPFNILDTGVALGIAFVLTWIVAKMYMHEHKRFGYEQGLVQSFVLVGVVVAAVIKVVGYNIAGAFGLVGAVSIIRFRTRLSSPKDTAYVFLSIAIGLACGLGQYIIGAVATALVTAILWLFWKVDFGNSQQQKPQRVLSIRVNDLTVGKKVFERVLLECADQWDMMSMNALDGQQAILDYQVTLRSDINGEALFQKAAKQSEGQYSILRFDVLNA
jgi:uncharacterized membrane protein YhiD involved in acid resistance